MPPYYSVLILNPSHHSQHSACFWKAFIIINRVEFMLWCLIFWPDSFPAVTTSPVFPLEPAALKREKRDFPIGEFLLSASASWFLINLNTAIIVTFKSYSTTATVKFCNLDMSHQKMWCTIPDIHFIVIFIVFCVAWSFFSFFLLLWSL